MTARARGCFYRWRYPNYHAEAAQGKTNVRTTKELSSENEFIKAGTETRIVMQEPKSEPKTNLRTGIFILRTVYRNRNWKYKYPLFKRPFAKTNR